MKFLNLKAIRSIGNNFFFVYVLVYDLLATKICSFREIDMQAIFGVLFRIFLSRQFNRAARSQFSDSIGQQLIFVFLTSFFEFLV